MTLIQQINVFDAGGWNLPRVIRISRVFHDGPLFFAQSIGDFVPDFQVILDQIPRGQSHPLIQGDILEPVASEHLQKPQGFRTRVLYVVAEGKGDISHITGSVIEGPRAPFPANTVIRPCPAR